MVTKPLAAHRRKVALALAAVALTACAAVAAGCAPQAATDNGAAAGTEPPTVEVAWSPDADCAVCHTTESAALPQTPCVAASNDSLNCASCHTDETGLAKAHDGVTTGGKTPSRLKSTNVDPAICESCHGSLESLAERTASSTVLTDANNTTVNPHALPATAKHASVTCGDCHKMHSGDNVATTAPKACSSCHHAGVYECGTCHEAE